MASQRSVSRILVNVALDGALAAAAAPIARWIADPQGGLIHPFWFLAGGGITLLLGGLPFRLSQQYWRFSGISDLVGVAGGSIAAALMFALLLIATGFPWPTETFPLVHAMTLAILLGAPRLAYRLYHARSRIAADDPGLERILLIGSGEGADGFIRALSGQRTARLRIAGLLSLADRQTGRRMHGHPILGGLDDLPQVLARLQARGQAADALVITEGDFRGPPLAALIAQAEAAGVAVRRAPSPTALVSADRIELRPVALEDLLNRPPVVLNQAGMDRLIAGQVVAITGAGGSIGAELARQVAARRPAMLLLLDNSEFALWQIDLELKEQFAEVPRRAAIADIRDAPRIAALFAEWRPSLVFHAAALKHVPIVEADPREGLLTNVCGTRVVADAAQAAGAAALVLISTDKAVNPTSLMGATKRLAEMYAQALDIEARAHNAGLRCITVRFGNVLGSTGSVVPLFRRQLEAGGPLTVTHPDMQRYFMTVREAVSLVLQAAVVGRESPAVAEHGGIFVLDMGKPMRILDLARQIIMLAGLRPDRDVGIVFTGLRPGEKLYEELFHGREPPVPTGFPGLLIAAPRTSDVAAVRAVIDEIGARCEAGEVARALTALRAMVPEYLSTVPAAGARVEA